MIEAIVSIKIHKGKCELCYILLIACPKHTRINAKPRAISRT